MAELPPARRGGLDQLALLQPVELRVDRASEHRLDRPHGELAADDRGGADDLPLGLRKGLDPRGQQHLDRPRQPAAGLALGEQGRQVLGEQRVALGGIDHVGGPVRRQRRAGVRQLPFSCRSG